MINIYLKKSPQQSTSQKTNNNSSASIRDNNAVKPNKNNQEHRGNITINKNFTKAVKQQVNVTVKNMRSWVKQVKASNSLKLPNLNNEILINNHPLTALAKSRLMKRKREFEGLAYKNQIITINTNKGTKKLLLEPDSDVKQKKGSSLWFQFKYYANKYGIDNIVDKATDLLPDKLKPIGLFKDYFKSDKDQNLFNPSEEVDKTAKDLHVDKKSAKFYVQFSDIENREKKLSPYKNIVSVPLVGKPVEFVMDALTQGTKKIIAEDYKKEYDYIIKQAKYYRQAGMKWKDVHKRVVEDLEEQQDAMVNLNPGEESTGTNYLNSVSVGQYKNISARAHLYILQAMENGDLK